MKQLNQISTDLFNKIRGRFENVTIGNENGEVTNMPEEARYFDFTYTSEGTELGKVSISLDPEQGISVIIGRDLVQGQQENIQDDWFNFLKELRVFSKKRMMKFEVRDINKSNLNKRDYQFLAQNRNGENTMAESKMYGTHKTSFQKIGNARLAIKHTAPINTESATGRNAKIGAIFIESPTGERFKYPFKHLGGARAMARHVSEGGNAYDDFGKHISGLSEEISKLRKFNQYMNRSAVMAETLAGYTGVVKGRVTEVKKEIANLQKEAYYKEAVENFVATIVEDVPTDVAENWIDQLTIKQFNEELQDVFPYIYKLIGEATKAQDLSPEDFLGEAESEEQVDEAYINTSRDAVEVLANLRKIGKSIERGQGEYNGNLANMYATDVWDVYSFIEARTNRFQGLDKNAKAAIEAMMDLRKEAKGMETKTGSGKNARFGNNIVTVLYPVMEYSQTTNFDRNAKEGNAYSGAVAKAKMNGKKKGDKIDGPDGDKIKLEKEDQKTPLGEFILSYFDRENGTFPKGETAILTMIEKDYGSQYVESAAQFIEKIQTVVAERQAEEATHSRYPETEMVKRLAGL